MSAVLFSGVFDGFDNNGVIVPYGRLYFTECCTGLPMVTYTDSLFSAENTNPVILSASGKAEVFLLDAVYDITLKDSNDVVLWTLNNYIPAGGTGDTLPSGYTEQYREEITGITGDTITLSIVPISDIQVHKNGLLLPSSDYSLLGDIITFITPLVPGDITVVEYIGLSSTSPTKVIYDVDVVADLALLDTTKITTAYAKGRITIDDEAGGIFNYDASRSGENDGGTVFDGWVRQYGGAVDVKWFGAKTDGNDCSVEVQKALSANGKNTKILFSNKGGETYTINTVLEIEDEQTILLDDGIILDCNVDGMVLIYKNLSDDARCGYSLGKNVVITCPNGRAEVKLNGTYSDAGAYRGFFAPVHTDGIEFSNIDFYDGNKTHIIELNSCQDAIVNNCGFFGNGVIEYESIYGYEAIQIDYSSAAGAPGGGCYDETPCKRVHITNNVFERCNAGVGSHAFNLNAETDSSLYHSDIIITDNVMEKCTFGVKSTMFRNSIISNNTMSGRFKRAIVIDSSDGVTISNNTIEFTSPSNVIDISVAGNGITTNDYIPDAIQNRNITIADNILFTNLETSDAFYPDIYMYLESVKNLTISGNNIIGGKYGVYVAGDMAAQVNVTANTIEDFLNGGVVVVADVTNEIMINNNSFNHGTGVMVTACLDIRNQVIGFVNMDGNTFSKNIAMANKYTTECFRLLTRAVDKTISLALAGDPSLTVGDKITLPVGLEADKFSHFIIGTGSVADTTFESHQKYPLDRTVGLRIADTLNMATMEGGKIVLTLNTLNEFEVTMATDTYGVRYLYGVLQ